MRDLLLIADSGPLIALASVQKLDILPKLYRRVAAPMAVINEVVASANLRPGYDLLHQAPWLEQLERSESLDALSIVLGRGESEAIHVARQEPTSLLLLDDAQARRAATALGLIVTGTAGVLVRAKREGFIESVRPLLLQMKDHGYYLSNKVIEYACREAGELI